MPDKTPLWAVEKAKQQFYGKDYDRVKSAERQRDIARAWLCWGLKKNEDNNQ